MIGIGVVREELVRDQEAHDRLVRVLTNGAQHDGLELATTVVFMPETIGLVVKIIAGFGDDVTVYAAQRSHVSDVISTIRDHAALTLVLDDISWPRTPRVTA